MNIAKHALPTHPFFCDGCDDRFYATCTGWELHGDPRNRYMDSKMLYPDFDEDGEVTEEPEQGGVDSQTVVADYDVCGYRPTL